MPSDCRPPCCALLAWPRAGRPWDSTTRCPERRPAHSKAEGRGSATAQQATSESRVPVQRDAELHRLRMTGTNVEKEGQDHRSTTRRENSPPEPVAPPPWQPPPWLRRLHPASQGLRSRLRRYDLRPRTSCLPVQRSSGLRLGLTELQASDLSRGADRPPTTFCWTMKMDPRDSFPSDDCERERKEGRVTGRKRG